MPGALRENDSGIARVLLGLTVATGLIDAVSYIALGHVFTANMTGNVVFLAFALVGVPGLSVPRSLVSLGAFLLGAVIGGRLALRAGAASDPPARWVRTAFVIEAVLLLGTAVAASVAAGGAPVVAYGIIVLTAVAMGVRNATVRKMAVPDLTTTVLTLTLTGLAADSPLGGGANPRALRRAASVACMFVGAAAGGVLLRHSLALPLLVSTVVSAACAMAVPISLRRAS